MTGPLTADQRLLVERHIGLAIAISHRMTIIPQDRQDIQSDAFLGLVNAARRRDPSRPFAPFAAAYIEGEIFHGRRDRSGFRTGRLHNRPIMVSLDDEDLALADEHAGDPAEVAELWDAVDRLPARDALVVRLYYQRDMTQEQIGVLLGVSKMRVSRILQVTRDQLRSTIGA